MALDEPVPGVTITVEVITITYWCIVARSSGPIPAKSLLVPVERNRY